MTKSITNLEVQQTRNKITDDNASEFAALIADTFKHAQRQRKLCIMPENASIHSRTGRYYAKPSQHGATAFGIQEEKEIKQERRNGEQYCRGRKSNP